MRMLGLSGAAHVDRRSIQHVLAVRRIVFLDHLDTGAAVFRNLIDVSTLHQPQTDIGMPQAVAGGVPSRPCFMPSSANSVFNSSR